MSVPDGYEKLPGRNSQNARKALDMAVRNGFNSRDVLTVRDGYLIPVSSGKPQKAQKAQEPADTPDSSWKNADIAKYAEDHSIDLDGATKKDDMLAAIAAAGNREE